MNGVLKGLLLLMHIQVPIYFLFQTWRLSVILTEAANIDKLLWHRSYMNVTKVFKILFFSL
jgi:hypothetical protein